MASPAVQTRATSSESTGTTSHTVTLPSGIASGDLLIIKFSVNNTVRTVTWPGAPDYTEFFDAQIGSDQRLRAAYRQADGGEGSTITVTTDGNTRSTHNSRRITGHEDPATQAPEVSSGATGTSTTPNSDSLTPTGGSKDYLWLAIVGSEGQSASAAPTNYTDLLTVDVTNCAAHSAERALTAASEDPGTFTIGASVGWVAATIAIHPAAAGGLSIPVAMASYRRRREWSGGA